MASIFNRVKVRKRKPKPRGNPVASRKGIPGGIVDRPVRAKPRSKPRPGNPATQSRKGSPSVKISGRPGTPAGTKGRKPTGTKARKPANLSGLRRAGGAADRTGQKLNVRAAGIAAERAGRTIPGTVNKKKATADAARRRSTGGSGGSGGVGGGGGRPAPVGGAGGSSGSSGATAGGASGGTSEETVEQYINRLYDPAFRSLARNRASLDAQLTANQASQQRFEEWLAAKRGEGRTWLQDMHRTANEHAASSQAQVRGVADQARAAAGATTAQFDPSVVSGEGGGVYNQQIASGNEQMLNTRVAAGTASTNSNLANFDAQALVADALNTNRRQQILAEYNKARRGYDDDEAKLRLQVGAAVREEEANRANREFMNAVKERELGIKEGGLEVDRINAQTRAWDAQAQAEYRVQSLRLRKLAEERKWTTAQFNARLQTEKLKIQQRATVRQQDNNAQAKATDAMSKALPSWIPTGADPLGRPIKRSITSLTGAERAQVAQRAITFLKARHPRLTAQAALQVITGVVGPNALLDDNGQPIQQLIGLINTSFTKGRRPLTPREMISGF